MLRSCTAMARRKPAFAELLLPLAFADLALHGEEAVADSAAVGVASAISAGLLPACPGHPKAMRLLLRCLNHLRGVYLDGTKRRTVGGRAPPAPAWPGQRALTAAEVRRWPKAYWIDLDYLALASVAVQ
jgi:hypothetical protein